MNEDSPQPTALPSQPPPGRARGLGCFAKGCLMTITVLMFLGIGVGTLGWFFMKSGQAYITEQQIPTRVADPTDAQYQDVLTRLQPFGQAMSEGRAATVNLTADDLNTLIARAPQLAPLRGEVFASLVGGQLAVEMSFPLSGTEGNPNPVFFNALTTLDASYASGKFTFALRRAVPLRGEATEGLLPWMLRHPSVLQTYSQILDNNVNHYARERSRKDPLVADLLAHLRTAVIENDHLVLTSVERPSQTPVATPSNLE